MTTHNWLPLIEYSAKYRVSLSTLRRRIKSGELEHKLVEGKYLLKDAPAPTASSSPSLQTNSKPETIAPPTLVRSQESGATVSKIRENVARENVVRENTVDQDQFYRSTQSLLNEIKKAYSLILQEKEEQILQLKEEVADLKTLVRVLEDDNNRLKTAAEKTGSTKQDTVVSNSSLDFDLGLEL